MVNSGKLTPVKSVTLVFLEKFNSAVIGYQRLKVEGPRGIGFAFHRASMAHSAEGKRQEVWKVRR